MKKMIEGINEETDQIVYVNWVRRTYGDEIWETLHHSPNGGRRDGRTGNRLKMMGTRAGFLDIVIYSPMECIDVNGKVYMAWPGMAFDLKKLKDGKPSKEQRRWAVILENAGFYIGDGFLDDPGFCLGVRSAMLLTIEYFGYGEIDESVLAEGSNELLLQS